MVTKKRGVRVRELTEAEAKQAGHDLAKRLEQDPVLCAELAESYRQLARGETIPLAQVLADLNKDG